MGAGVVGESLEAGETWLVWQRVVPSARLGDGGHWGGGRGRQEFKFLETRE